MTSNNRYRVFTRRHDVELSADWLVQNPHFEPFAAGRETRDAEPYESYLATEAEIASTILNAGNDYPDFSDVSVTLLLDQSGSQRGVRREASLTCWTDLTVEALVHLGAEVEVLGFTTLRWKGGNSRQDWIAAGRPMTPGRLNDLLHIVYKAADDQWRLGADPSPRECLDRIYREPYLREGIDGEAVEWAAGRLKARSRGTKILLVASDCAPVDDSTLSTNPDGILSDHLRKVVAVIEATGIAVVSIDNGTPSMTTNQELYARTAYRSAYRCFDAAEAASSTMRAVAEIVAPAPVPHTLT